MVYEDEFMSWPIVEGGFNKENVEQRLCTDSRGGLFSIDPRQRQFLGNNGIKRKFQEFY